jgi:outer membrane protein assembly factor BamB
VIGRDAAGRLGRVGIATLLPLVLAAFHAAGGENWPQWRGPANDGVAAGAAPTKWGPDQNVLWKAPLPGPGGSTPAIWGDRLFLTAAAGSDVVLLCLGTDGRPRWDRKLGTGGRTFRGDEGNDASPSPSTDGRRVYAFAGTGDFAAFDLDGQELWRFNAQDRYGRFKIMHGMHTTPLLHKDRLYLSLLHENGHWIVALDAATGREVWKVRRPTDGRFEGEHSYASPCLWHKGDQEYLVVHGCDYATAHRLADGSEIWRLGDLNPKSNYNPTLRFVASPAASPDLIVVPTAKNGPVVGLKPDASGLVGAGAAAEAWRMPRGTPDVPSPLIHQGLVYLCRENGILICLEAATGKEHYQERLHSARYRASPVLIGDKIYLTARDGTFSVVKAGPRFELLATNRLPDTFTASPATAGGRLYLRGFEALYCVAEAR